MTENLLYTSFAPLYSRIAEDRNFEEECRWILSQHENAVLPLCAVELFAGPAYHARVLHALSHRMTAIDASFPMKRVACEGDRPFPDEYYLIGSIPEIFKERSWDHLFDLVLIMRYSLGLIAPHKVAELFTVLSSLVSKRGVVILELHCLDHLVSNFQNLKIRVRNRPSSVTETESIQCFWPDGKITWDENQWRIKMPIRIDVTRGDQTESLKTASEEYIYTVADLERISDNFSVDPASYDHSPLFPDSKMVILRRK